MVGREKAKQIHIRERSSDFRLEREREREVAGAMEDDSCRRAGAIPFKWEVCPGTPKHTRSASAVTAAASPAKVAPKLKLTPPPSMASSPLPYYHHHHSAASSPRASSARSASVSPSRRRPYAYAGGHCRAPPTAFIDAAPKMLGTEYGGAAHEAETAAFGCFGLPMLRRKKAAGFGFGSVSSFNSSSSSSGASSFRSDGGGLGMRRSASISSASSLPLPPGRRYAAEARAEVDAIAATGRGWYF